MKRETTLTELGRDAAGFVNPPIVRGSTVIFKTREELDTALKADLKEGPYTYGLMGTPTERAMEVALAELDGGEAAVLLGSGLAAVSVAIMSGVRSGDHLLMVDTCYAPTRILCDGMLADFGVETEYYDPLVSQPGKTPIESLFRKNTRMVYMESPGSRTFEMQDVPAIVNVCREHGITSVIDNTWATPLAFRPIEHGADYVVHALTKYVAGHSDVMLGSITARTRAGWNKVKMTAVDLGHGCSPDDAWLGLRGLRSLAARLDRHESSAMKIARWLESRPEVRQVLHPALESHPGHYIWKRDFDRATGLFGLELHTADHEAVSRMVEGFSHFKMGYSWGGFESLMIPLHPDDGVRTATSAQPEGAVLRCSIGLEDPDDLIADLESGLLRLQNPA